MICHLSSVICNTGRASNEARYFHGRLHSFGRGRGIVGQRLVGEIQIDPQVNSLIDNENRISLDSPFDLQDNDSVKLSIYLYRITENATTKNQVPVQGNGGQIRKTPLTLDLHYLVTPLVGTVTDQQIILGKVMQVLYDRAILQGAD